MKRIVLAAACVVALAGCNGEGDDPTPSVAPTTAALTETATPVPTVTSTPTPTPEPTPTATAAGRPWTVDLSGVVDDGEVTIEEAQQIIDAHDALINRALIPFLTSDPKPDVVPRSVAQAYLATHPDQLGDIFLNRWRDAIANNFELYNTTDPTGFKKTVREVRGWNDRCISLQLEEDFAGLVVPSQAEVITSYIELERLDSPKLGNATRWIRTDDAVTPPDPGFSCLERG